MNFELFYETTGISTDTRNIEKDCMFICLKGANFNGNTFALQAIEAGAKYVIADEKLTEAHAAIIYVPDALMYLQKLANYHRSKFNIPVLGITGSNGKTTSKELISTVLAQKYNVHFTQGNLNNHIGVPLTLLKLTNAHEIAVIEMGANKFKDIEELCQIAKPTHGIITNIGKAHLEGFINFEGVLKTKLELYQSVAEIGGVLFYNNDDETLKNNLPSTLQTISYGSENDSFIKGELIALNPFVEMRWKCNEYVSEDFQTQMIGKYNFYNFLAAIAIGTFFKVSNEAIQTALTIYSPSNNRSQVKRTTKNTLILDAYNANPTSMQSAIESFAMMQFDSKKAILGDMFELGQDSYSEHKKIIELVQKFQLPVFFIGKRFAEVITQEKMEAIFFATKEEAKTYLENNPIEQELVLLKGSRGIGLEELVDHL